MLLQRDHVYCESLTETRFYFFPAPPRLTDLSVEFSFGDISSPWRIIWMVRTLGIKCSHKIVMILLTVWREEGGSGISRRYGGGCAGQWIHHLF